MITNHKLIVNGGSLAVQWCLMNRIDDARLRRRLESVIGFLWVSFKGLSIKGLSRELSSDTLRDAHAFGGGEAMRVLKNVLLIENKRFVVGGRSNTYCLVRHEFLALVEHLGMDAKEMGERWRVERVLALSECYAEELRSGVFSFADPRHDCQRRVYHPLVSQPRAVRDAVLLRAGLPYQYDIKSAFPTLLAQCGFSGPLPTLNKLVDAPDEFRASIAFDLGLNRSQVKEILSALLFGARARGVYREQAITEILGSPYDGQGEYLWNRLCAHKLVQGLVIDYAEIQRQLHRSIIDNPDSVFHSIAKSKWLYFWCEFLEAKVRDAMSELVLNDGGRVFPIHDCIATDLDLDADKLENYIDYKTGYSVKLSKSQYQ